MVADFCNLANDGIFLGKTVSDPVKSVAMDNPLEKIAKNGLISIAGGNMSETSQN